MTRPCDPPPVSGVATLRFLWRGEAVLPEGCCYFPQQRTRGKKSIAVATPDREPAVRSAEAGKTL